MGELYYISYYFHKGHTLDYLLNLTPLEKEFAIESMLYEIELENCRYGGENK
jgi:hypothetical protein